jgi:hypothetical protein
LAMTVREITNSVIAWVWGIVISVGDAVERVWGHLEHRTLRDAPLSDLVIVMVLLLVVGCIAAMPLLGIGARKDRWTMKGRKRRR